MNPNNDQQSPIQPPSPPQPPTPGIGSRPEPQLLGYDHNGNPLFGTPSTQQPAQPHQPQHPKQPQPPVPIRSNDAPRLTNTNPSAVRQAQVHEDVEALHRQSCEQYPKLNLSSDEYVIANVERHPIGIILPVIGGVVLICLILIGVFTYPMFADRFLMDTDEMATKSLGGVVVVAGILASAVIALFTYIATWIYHQNRFFLTNESIIQEIQLSLFNRHEQTVSLGNVEDASFFKRGIVQAIFDYGSIRLSTEGDETTYRMDFIAAPRRQIAQLTNAVEDYKNGRMVEGRVDSN